MKSILIFLLVFMFGCTQNQQNKATITNTEANQTSKELGSDLLKNGFLKYADSSEIDSLSFEILNSFYFYNENNFKVLHVDAEALAEFNFDFFLPSLNKILERRQIFLNISTAKDYSSSYEILIDDDKIKLYTQEELNNGIFWDKASRNFFKKVNDILKSKNLEEKFYLLYGGNDLNAILLTESQFKIIQQYFLDNKNETPYLP